MAATHRTRIKQLERADAELAALRDQRAQIDARIASLESTRKDDLIVFATDILNGMNLAQVSASTICAALHDAVDRCGGNHAAEVEEIVDEEKADTFVRISRNAGKRKRAVLVRCGLHWHGRDGVWTGRVGDATLTKLRDVFGDKVEKPALIAPGESPLPAQDSAAAPARVDEEPVTVQSQPVVAAAESSSREVTTSAPVHRIPLFHGSFPQRRPVQQQSEEPS